MNEEMQAVILNGMPLGQFVAYYLVGVFGIAFFFLSNLLKAIETDPTTPRTFQWIYFVKGLIRVVLALMALAFGIVYFSELMGYIVDVPQGAEVEITGFSALLVGISVDQLSKKLVSLSIGSYKGIQKRMKQ